jgi:hypothetical protein
MVVKNLESRCPASTLILDERILSAMLVKKKSGSVAHSSRCSPSMTYLIILTYLAAYVLCYGALSPSKMGVRAVSTSKQLSGTLELGIICELENQRKAETIKGNLSLTV